MAPERPDIIQCVWASQALACFGRAFRSAGSKGRESFPTDHIQEFWSHSWHGNKWHKVLTAIYLCNGMMAAAVASLGALLLWTFVAWSHLPTEPLNWWREQPAASFWCTGASIALYCWALFFLQRRRRVFLDVLCIDQQDTSLKAAGGEPKPAGGRGGSLRVCATP